VLQHARIFYARVDEFWRKEQKYHYLDEVQQQQKVEWKSIHPDEKNTWLTEGLHDEFKNFLPIANKAAKAGLSETALFEIYSLGINTNRDSWAYNFKQEDLTRNMSSTIDVYNQQVSSWSRLGKKPPVDEFVLNDDKKISWSSRLKECLQRGMYAEYSEDKIRHSMYRPFCKEFLFIDEVMTHRRGRFPLIFPSKESEFENRVICVTAIANTKPFHCLVTRVLPDLHLTGDSQCFPFYTYDEDGSNRRENITDWAVKEFARVYNLTPALSKGEGGLGAGSAPLSTGEGLGLPAGQAGVRSDPPYMTTDAETWKHLKPLARELRKEQTEAEEKLWQHLRNQKLGFKFRRQHAIGEFIVDFVCIEKKLVVELDGEIHKEQREYDAERTRILNGRGFRVIRFWNSEVTNNIKDVLARIKHALTAPFPFVEGPASPTNPFWRGMGSSPLSRGEGQGVRSITKLDIFHYIYALLHHPTYRERYAANLRRELPRIPFAKDFWAFAEAGKKLATLHVEYEKQKQYKLEVVESKVGHLNYRVEKMKLSKDKKTLIYNDFFTLGGIPKEAFEYRLGNRSALEWIIDQYQVSTDKRSGITNDPNRNDDPEYIMRLIDQVITVSVETVKIVKSLPKFEVLSESKKS
jgi:predicted helicase/very-short-patch-repair endonuclease